MTNLQIMIKAMAKFCEECPKNNTIECNPLRGDYCETLTKHCIALQENMKKEADNAAT